MKTHIKSQVTISATPNRIFHYLVNLKYHHLWNPHLVRVSPADLRLKRGSQYKADSLIFGVRLKSLNLVMALRANEELGLENNTGLIQYQVNYRLHASGEHTLVVCTTHVSSDSNAFAFVSPVLKTLAKRELQTDLQALKTVVEQRLAVD